MRLSIKQMFRSGLDEYSAEHHEGDVSQRAGVSRFPGNARWKRGRRRSATADGSKTAPPRARPRARESDLSSPVRVTSALEKRPPASEARWKALERQSANFGLPGRQRNERRLSWSWRRVLTRTLSAGQSKTSTRGGGGAFKAHTAGLKPAPSKQSRETPHLRKLPRIGLFWNRARS